MPQTAPSKEMHRSNRALRWVIKPMLKYIPNQRLIHWMGQRAKAPTGPAFDGAVVKQIRLTAHGAEVSAIEARPDRIGQDAAAILYFHGGAYTTMSAATHAPHAKRLAAHSGWRVICPDYRIAIQAPYPAAVDDAETSYEALLQQGLAPAQIALCGDSAGGGLALALLLRLKAKGRPLPACAATQSPWVDLTLSRASIDSCAVSDVILSREWLARAARIYAGSAARDHPELSPLFADLAGLPPQLVLYSEAEILRDECAELVARLRAAGVPVDVLTDDHAPHGWPISAPQTPEAEAGFSAVAGFIGRHLDSAP